MRTDSPQNPRTPEPAPRRTAAAAAASAATPGTPKAGASSCAFAAMLLAADAGHEAQAPAPLAQADPKASPDPELSQGKSSDPATTVQAPPRSDPAESTALMARLEPKANGTPATAPTPATPAAPDAQATTAAPAGPASAEGPAGRKAGATPASAAWVSTLARARASAGATAGAAAAPKPGAELPAAPSANFLAAAGPAAAAALRFAAPAAGSAAVATQYAWASTDSAAGMADEAGATALTTASSSARSDAGSREGSGQGTRGGDAAQTWVDNQASSASAGEASAVGAEFGQLLEQQVTGQGLEAVLEPLNQHISLWLAGQVKRANLVLHEGLGQPLEIGMQLDGNQARLDFLTDDAALLEALQAQAPEALSELLGQSGLELVGLSIGSRASGQSDRPAQPRPEWARARSDGAEQADSAAQAPTLQWQLGSGRAGLSVYA